MEAVRAAIEKQVLSLTGLALGGVDFENPPGDPGLFGPQSVIWQVHRDFTPMLCGASAPCCCRCCTRWRWPGCGITPTSAKI